MINNLHFKVLFATICLLLFTLFSISSSTIYAETAAPLLSAESDNVIPDQYIVVLSGEQLPIGDRADKAQTRSASKIAQAQEAILETHQATVESHGGVIGATYHTVLFGYAAYLPPKALEQVRHMEGVQYVQPVQIVSISSDQSNPPSWGLDRIDETDLTLDQLYHYDSTGAGVHAYVIDSGIRGSHEDFSGRIGNGINFVSSGGLPVCDYFPVICVDPGNWGDCNGHGTHVAGTLGGTKYGVAKDVTLHAVRVMDCYGNGSVSGIIEGLDWIGSNGQRPAVVNMSLSSTGSSTSLDQAVRNLVEANIPVVVGAGNSNKDACNFSPARELTAITVGAIDSDDSLAYYSNHGQCVDILAPGSDITSASHTGNSDEKSDSGTSMAAPHVAGVVALFLENNPNASSPDVASYLIENSTWGVVSDLPSGTPNTLLHSLENSDGGPPGLSPVNGSLKQVDARDYDRAVGVNANNRIFYYDYDSNGWTRIGGRLKHVSIGVDGSIWGVNSNNRVYRRLRADTGNWVRMPGALKQVDALHYGLVVGVAENDTIWYYNDHLNDGWTQIGGRLKHASIGLDGSIWGVNANNHIYRRTSAASGSWERIPGSLKQIDALDYDHAIGVNASNEILRYDVNHWDSVEESMAHASLGMDNSVWAVDTNDQIFRMGESSITQSVNTANNNVSDDSETNINAVVENKPTAVKFGVITSTKPLPTSFLVFALAIVSSLQLYKQTYKASR